MRTAFLIVLVVMMGGCSKLGNLDKMLTLKELADYQEATDAHIEARESNFNALLEDVSAGNVDQFANQEDLVGRYGEPVYVKKVSYQSQSATMWMYRLPVKFMGSDKVFFYFDDEGDLIAHDVQRSDK